MTDDNAPAPVRAGRGRPAKISRQDIIQAAMQSRRALSLKGIARTLGVTPQALHRHIHGYADLINEIVHVLVAQEPPPRDTGQSWSAWAMDTAHYIFKIYSLVPGLAENAMRAPLESPVIAARMEESLAVAKRCGFDMMDALWATHAILEFVHAWVFRQESRDPFTRETGDSQDAIIKRSVIDSDSPLPLYREALEAEARSSESRLDFQLRALIAGLEATLSARSARAAQ